MTRSRPRTSANRYVKEATDPLGKFLETAALSWYSDSRYRERLTREARPTAAEKLKQYREKRTS